MRPNKRNAWRALRKGTREKPREKERVMNSKKRNAWPIESPDPTFCKPVFEARFLGMAKAAQDVDRVIILYEEGKGGEHYRKQNKYRSAVAKGENWHLVK